MKSACKSPLLKVPCVQLNTTVRGWVAGDWVPVIGPLHEDGEIIGFPEMHWHIDWRFVPQFEYDFVVREDRPGLEFAYVISGKNTNGPPQIKRRKQRREMGPWLPQHRDEVGWLHKLEMAYEEVRMKCLVCPHRGLPLDGLPVKDGVVTCPGHGLRWRVADGTQVMTSYEEAKSLRAIRLTSP